MDKLPTEMTVVAISQPGGPDVLKPQTRPLPQVGPHDVLIKVAAAGVNRPDVAQRAGSYPPPPGASDLPRLPERSPPSAPMSPNTRSATR